jgi:hypothetical protein
MYPPYPLPRMGRRLGWSATGAAACGVVAPLVFTAAWMLAGAVQHEYDAWREDISGLAALTADHAWIMIAGFIAAGALSAVFAVGLLEAVRSKLGAALTAFAGAGLVGLGLLRNDCSSMTAACEARVAAGDVSWHHTAHDALSAPVFAAATLTPLVIGLRFAADARTRRLALLSVATTPLLVVLFVLGGIEPVPAWNGTFQRAAATVAFAWMGIVAIHLLRIRGARQ